MHCLNCKWHYKTFLTQVFCSILFCYQYIKYIYQEAARSLTIQIYNTTDNRIFIGFDKVVSVRVILTPLDFVSWSITGSSSMMTSGKSEKKSITDRPLFNPEPHDVGSAVDGRSRSSSSICLDHSSSTLPPLPQLGGADAEMDAEAASQPLDDATRNGRSTGASGPAGGDVAGWSLPPDEALPVLLLFSPLLLLLLMLALVLLPLLLLPAYSIWHWEINGTLNFFTLEKY